MAYVVRPLGPWTEPRTAERRRSPFSASWSDTLDLLEREIRLLGFQPRPWVLQIDVSERWIRQDGELYARAQPAMPAVRVAFESRHGPLTHGCNRFDRWQDNVRAIALSLEPVTVLIVRRPDG